MKEKNTASKMAAEMIKDIPTGKFFDENIKISAVNELNQRE